MIWLRTIMCQPLLKTTLLSHYLKWLDSIFHYLDSKSRQKPTGFISVMLPPSFLIAYTTCFLYLRIDAVLNYPLPVQIPSFTLPSFFAFFSSPDIKYSQKN